MTDHDDLLAQVRATYQALDPLPEEVLAAGRSAFAWRTPGAEPAELFEDRTGRPAGVRGDGRDRDDGADGADGQDGAALPRTLMFTARDTVIELEIAGTGREREITGRLAPPSPARVQVRHLDLPCAGLVTQADRAGQFALPGLPAGLVSLLFHLPDGTSIATSWIRL